MSILPMIRQDWEIASRAASRSANCFLLSAFESQGLASGGELRGGQILIEPGKKAGPRILDRGLVSRADFRRHVGMVDARIDVDLVNDSVFFELGRRVHHLFGGWAGVLVAIENDDRAPNVGSQRQW